MQRVGCFTTARVTRGRIERLERHARRLARDADRLGLPLPDRAAIEAAAIARARAELGQGDGIVRIEWSASPPDPHALRVTTRPLGFDGSIWRAISAAVPHPGPEARHGAKAIGVVAWEAARAEAHAAGVEEALLFDDAGRLVEGSRTNLIVVPHAGDPWTPAPALGAVEGLGLACVQEAVPELRASEAIDRDALRSARELVAVNAVRGAVAVVALDGEPIGDGRMGPLARRLRGLIVRDPST
ncbi:MAG: aminotransferase class IV [Myxococcota bacterium]